MAEGSIRDDGELDAELVRLLRVRMAHDRGVEGRSAVPVGDHAIDAQIFALQKEMVGCGYDWPAILRDHLLYPVIPDWKPTSERGET